MIEQPKLLDRLRDRIQLKHYSIRTEKIYKHVDFDMKQIAVRIGKGKKDRLTMLPETIIPSIIVSKQANDQISQ